MCGYLLCTEERAGGEQVDLERDSDVSTGFSLSYCAAAATIVHINTIICANDTPSSTERRVAISTLPSRHQRSYSHTPHKRRQRQRQKQRDRVREVLRQAHDRQLYSRDQYRAHCRWKACNVVDPGSHGRCHLLCRMWVIDVDGLHLWTDCEHHHMR